MSLKKHDLIPATEDNVNWPQHYLKAASTLGVEPADIILAFQLPWTLGNTIKYILRAGEKDGKYIEDLQKAVWYLVKEIRQYKQDYQPTNSLTAGEEKINQETK